MRAVSLRWAVFVLVAGVACSGGSRSAIPGTAGTPGIPGGEVHPTLLPSGVAVLRTTSGVWAMRGGRVTSVPASRAVGAVEVSADHRHVAWIESPAGSPARAVIFDLDTGKPNEVGFPVPDVLMWSPDGRRLASSSSAAGGLWVVDADGTNLRQLVGGGDQVDSMQWEPDSRGIAFSGTGIYHRAGADTAGYDGIWIVPVGGGDRVTIVAPKPTRESGYLLAGSVGPTLLAWVDPQHSASLAADGLELVALAAGRAPVTVTTTLPSAGFAVALPDGDLVAVEGSGRELSTGKRLVRCQLPAGGCTPLSPAPGKVQLEPAVGPDGRVAFITATDVGSSGVADWSTTRTLSILDGSVALVGGVFAPRWTAEGDIVIERHAGSTVELWRIAPRPSQPARLVARFTVATVPAADRAGTSLVAFVP